MKLKVTDQFAGVAESVGVKFATHKKLVVLR